MDMRGIVQKFLNIPQEEREAACDLARQAELYGIQKELEVGDVAGAVRKMLSVDAPETIANFLMKYLNIDRQTAENLLRKS